MQFLLSKYRQRKLKDEVYVNKPSEEYFAQFNTTSR